MTKNHQETERIENAATYQYALQKGIEDKQNGIVNHDLLRDMQQAAEERTKSGDWLQSFREGYLDGVKQK